MWASTPNPSRAHHNIVPEPFLRNRRPRVPIILEKDGIDTIGVVGPQPVETGPLGIELTIDPELEDTVRLPGVVELDAGLDAVPLPNVVDIK